MKFDFFKKFFNKKEILKDSFYIFLDDDKKMLDFLIFKPEIIFNDIKNKNANELVSTIFALDYFLNRKDILKEEKEYQKRLDIILKENTSGELFKANFTNFPYFSQNKDFFQINETIEFEIDKVFDKNIFKIANISELSNFLSKKDYQRVFVKYTFLNSKDKDFIFKNYYKD